MNYSDKNSTQLRSILQDKYPGRTGDIRSLVKDEHIWMLENGIDLDEMLERKENDEPPYFDGEFEPKQVAVVSNNDSQPKPKPKPRTNGRGGGGLEDVIISSIMERIDVSSVVDKDEIAGMIDRSVQEHISEVKQIDWVVKRNGQKNDVGQQHKQFEKLVKITQTGKPIAMVGPAGSFKSTASENLAEALDLDYYAISCNKQTTKTDFFGYMDANGNYVPTQFYKAVKHGGVFMADEMDAANPDILTATNAATGGNKKIGFPNEVVEIHEDFIFVAGMNTYGAGANRMYVGRNQLDAATLDRFVYLDWDYDEKLERKIVGNDEWVDTVHKIRRAVEELGIRTVVSPRASIAGAQLLDAGFTNEEVMKMTIWKGMDESTVNTIRNKTGV